MSAAVSGREPGIPLSNNVYGSLPSHAPCRAKSRKDKDSVRNPVDTPLAARLGRYHYAPHAGQ